MRRDKYWLQVVRKFGGRNWHMSLSVICTKNSNNTVTVKLKHYQCVKNAKVNGVKPNIELHFSCDCLVLVPYKLFLYEIY